MVNEIHGTQNISFLEEATFGTDPITDENTAIYNFGKYQTTFDFPTDVLDITPVYYDLLDPTELLRTKSNILTNIVMMPVNGLFYYYAFNGPSGAGVAHNAGTFTLTPQNTVDLTSLTIRTDTQNSLVAVKEHYVGNKIKAYVENIDLTLPNQPQVATLLFDGQKRVDPGFAPDNSPVYPSSQENLYRKDSNFVFQWDSGGDQVDYSDKLLNFTWRVDNLNTPLTVDDQIHPEAIQRGNRLVTWAADIVRAGDTSIWDDYKAYRDSETKKNLLFKIFNTSANFKQLTFNNNAMKQPTLNRTLRNVTDKPVYRVEGIATTVSPIVKDSLATSFYGV